jgi:putative oxidoreductase
MAAATNSTFPDTSMACFPYVSHRHSLVIIRLVLATLFMAHAIVRILNGSIPQFGGFMESKGFPNGVAVVWCITVFEILAGLALIINYKVRYFAAGLFVMVFAGILLIHMSLGWFVGEHGTGGSEYSVALMAMLLVVATADSKAVQKAASGGFDVTNGWNRGTL